MTKGRAALLAVASIVFLTVGFVIGQMVQAAGAIPGSAGDPLVARSYVKKIVGETVAGMQTKIDELQAAVDDLEKKVEVLSPSTPSTSPADQEPTSGTKVVTVTGKSANIRTGPGTNYDKITTLVQGDKASFAGEENGWYQIVLPDGRKGWVANWLVQVK